MWLRVMGMTTTERQTFPPTFYLTEMNSIYLTIHPVSLLMYILGFVGLGFFAVRHQKADKLLLTWFVTTIVFYTLVSNKNWRYSIPLFPVLAVSAAVVVTVAYAKTRSLNRKTLAKIGGATLIALTALAMFWSVSDAVIWEKTDKIDFALQQAVDYAVTHDGAGQAMMVLVPDNYFSQGIIEYYLLRDGENQIPLYSYPWSRIIDQTFNVTVIVDRCVEYNVKFLLLTEYRGNHIDYFNSTVTLMDIFDQLYNSNNFTHVSPEQTFGESPNCIYILNFTGRR